ncbi:Magnesium transporter MgtE [Ferriphaselus amnicola]|uniref:Magnesium transporter MgtE n=1 Tax=Ferriphaselus amnicola TaxID=1188319 RepID=A0A2Z6GBF0_9PROT|nr:Magnesium transporter MgtE [Ferriphaselus amnicola]
MVSAADILNARILIVDDLDANVQLLNRMLVAAGYTSVESTTDPLAVCELHRNRAFDLILLDLKMPMMDGFQVMEALKENELESYLPVLVITAQPEQKLHALQAGAKDFISKPFDLPEVLVRVHNMLEVRLLHDESKRYSIELEHKIDEVEASRELIRQQSVEVQTLYDKVIAEQKRSVELSMQPGAMVGVEKEERLATPWFRSLWLRHPWLQVNLLTAFAAATVVGMFQSTIDRLLILTVFLPILAGQSGNTGSQALAITLRGITLGDLKSGKERQLVKKEALLGLLNGVLVGVVAAIGMYALATAQHVPKAGLLGLVVLLAMIVSCVISSICGALVPLILKRIGADPATASSIFLSTATDVVSMGMLLGLATLMVR